MNIQLKNKVCLVTGGDRGIGKAICKALVDSGARVAFDYRTREDLAQALVDEITAGGGEAKAFQADITDEEKVASMVQTIHDEMGPIEVLVNNAGMNRDHTFAKMTKEEWDQVIAVNLTGGFNVSKAVLPNLLEALELAGKGVTVNAVAPGFIETDMTAGIPEEVTAKIHATIPMRRYGKPEEIAPAVVFLASEEASYITGHVLSVNGGLYL